MNKFGTRGLTGLLGDVRRTNNFILTIAGINPDQNLDLVIRRAFLPRVSLNPLDIRRGNDSIKLAGVASWQGGQITILDTLSRKELDAVLEWFNQTYDTETGAIGLASEYKKDGTITEYASNGRMVRQWTVNNMWISELNLGELSMADGTEKEIQLTIQIDPSPLKPIYSDPTEPTYNE